MGTIEINQIYDSLVQENQEKMLEAKKLYHKESALQMKAIIASVVFIFIGLPFIVASINLHNIYCFLLFLFFLAIMIFFVLNYVHREKPTLNLEEYRNYLNMQALYRITDLFDGETKIFPDNGIAKTVYLNATFEPFKYYGSATLIQKKLYHNYELNMSIVQTSIPTSSIDNPLDHIIFCGEFAQIKVNINQQLYLLIRQRKAKMNLKKDLLDKLSFSLDFKDFEDLFDVYTNDKHLTLQILTPETMKNLVEMVRQYNMQYEITIQDSNIYIRVKEKTISHLDFLTNFEYDKKVMVQAYTLLKFLYELSTYLIEILEMKKI